MPSGGSCFFSTRKLLASREENCVAVDLQVCFPQTSIRITAVSVVPGASPPAIDILGVDFSSVDSVLVNEMAAPSFYVVSKTRMIVTLPSGVTSAQITSLAVTSRQLVLSPQSLLVFQISQVPSKVTGILRLVQLFTKVLFTTPGSDIFSKGLGGSGLKNLGRSFSKVQSGGIVSDFVVAVDNTTRQIVRIQGQQPQIPSDEKLLTARVTTANFSLQQSALVCSVELTSQAGRAALANVIF